MTKQRFEQCEQEWQAAEAALNDARRMPGGAERVEALRKAGQLRYDADKLRREIEQESEPARATAGPGSAKVAPHQ